MTRFGQDVRSTSAWLLAACIFLVGLSSSASVEAQESYRYDDSGRLVEVSYENGARIAYEYDETGRLVRTVRESGTEVPDGPGGPADTGDSSTNADVGVRADARSGGDDGRVGPGSRSDDGSKGCNCSSTDRGSLPAELPLLFVAIVLARARRSP